MLGPKSNGPCTKMSPVSHCGTSVWWQKLQKNLPPCKALLCMVIIMYLHFSWDLWSSNERRLVISRVILKFDEVNLLVPSMTYTKYHGSHSTNLQNRIWHEWQQKYILNA